MADSAIFTGGLEQFAAALVVALFVLWVVPPEVGNGWTRWRLAAFYILWQAFTPIRPWYVDLPLLLFSAFMVEWAYRIRRLRKLTSRGTEL